MARTQPGAQVLHTIQDLPNKIVGQSVVDQVAFPVAGQDGMVGHEAQLLGGRRPGKADVGLNIGNPLLSQGQVLNDLKSHGVSQGLQYGTHVGQEGKIYGRGRWKQTVTGLQRDNG